MIADILCAPEERAGRVAVARYTISPGERRMTGSSGPGRRNWRASATMLRRSSTGNTSTRSITASQATSCSRSPRIRLGSRWTSPSEALGSKLQLPPWLEASRDELMAILPPIRLPAVRGAAQR